MDELLKGFAVPRAIPIDTIEGLGTGRYTQHGGVIRTAPGVEGAGQIVRHLLLPQQAVMDVAALARSPAAGWAVRTGQQLLNRSQQNMALASLNLAATGVSFAVLHHKMDLLETKIDRIAAEVHEIREAQDRRDRAEFLAALNHLVHAERMSDVSARREVIGRAHRDLGIKKEEYADAFAKAATPATFAVFEECYCVALLAYTRCYGELGSVDIAREEIDKGAAFWRETTTRAARDILLPSNAQRFLYAEFTEDAPVALIAGWLDFALGQERGVAWIDKLRSGLGSYYGRDTRPLSHLADLRKLPTDVGRTVDSMKRMARRESADEPTTAERLACDKEVVIPTLNRIAAREPVLAGYVDQYRLLAENGLKPSEFDRMVADVPEERTVQGFVVLTAVEAAGREVPAVS